MYTKDEYVRRAQCTSCKKKLSVVAVEKNGKQGEKKPLDLVIESQMIDSSLSHEDE